MLYRRQESTEGPFIETDLFGYELLNDPLLNKGTAFTDEERDAFELHGLLPLNVATLDEQVARRMQAFLQLPSDLERYVFLRGLQDSVEVLFYDGLNVVETRIGQNATRARETSNPCNFRQPVSAERGRRAGSPAGHQRQKRAAVDCTAAQAAAAVLQASGTGNTATVNGPRPRLLSGRSSAHCALARGEVGYAIRALHIRAKPRMIQKFNWLRFDRCENRTQPPG